MHGHSFSKCSSSRVGDRSVPNETARGRCSLGCQQAATPVAAPRTLPYFSQHWGAKISNKVHSTPNETDPIRMFRQLYLNSPKLETTRVSTNKRINKHIVDIHTMKYYLGIKRNEQLIYSTTWMNLTDIMLRKKKSDTKVHTMGINLMFKNIKLIHDNRNHN